MSRWPTKRLRFLLNKAIPTASRRLVEEASEVTFLPMEAIGEQGALDTSRVIKFDEASAGYTLFFDGDVVVAKITPCFENGKGALIEATATGLGLGTTELYVLRPGANLDGRYLYYITVDPAFRILGETQMTGAAGQKRVPEDFIRNYIVAVPPVSEQRQIGRYLDTEIGIIDTLISTKVAWLELLAEKRRAIVAEAVMRGLNPAARLRPSGIDWLGDIPAHWQMKRSKWLFEERDERSTDGSEVLLSLRMERGLVPHNDVSEKLTRPEELIGYKKTSVGQLVVNRMRAATGLIAITTQDGLVSPDYAVFWPSPEISADYYVHMFKTPLLQAVFRSESTGLGTGSQGFLRLYSENFLALWFPYPPLDEQHEIVRHIAAETGKIDRLRAATEYSIALLKERRGALIAAAVTGQIDVPEAA
jgi:type I restriction enzyme, S subunit